MAIRLRNGADAQAVFDPRAERPQQGARLKPVQRLRANVAVDLATVRRNVPENPSRRQAYDLLRSLLTVEAKYFVAHLVGLDDCVKQGFVRAALRRKSRARSRRFIKGLPPVAAS
jgi:hypothetical protein